MPGSAPDRAVRARHQHRAQFQYRRPDQSGERRRHTSGGVLRRPRLHRGGAELCRLRHLDPELSPVSGGRAAVKGHDRRADRGALGTAHQLEGERRWPIVHYGILAGRLRGNGDAPRDAGRRHDGHRFSADVRTLCARGLRRRRVCGRGQRRGPGGGHSSYLGISTFIRQHLYQRDRCLCCAVRSWHSDAVSQHHVQEPDLCGRFIAANCAVRLDSAKPGVRCHHTGDDPSQSGAGFRAGIWR